MRYSLFFFCLLLILCNCKDNESQQKDNHKSNQPKVTKLKYAQGFKINTYENFKVLEISKPWKDSKKTYRFALIDDTENIKAETLIEKLSKTSPYDGVVKIPLESIVVTFVVSQPPISRLNALA